MKANMRGNVQQQNLSYQRFGSINNIANLQRIASYLLVKFEEAIFDEIKLTYHFYF
jgi:hypothetical protein